MTDLLFALLLLGFGAAVLVLPKLLEAESGDAGLLEREPPAPRALSRLVVAHLVLFLFTLPLYLRLPQEGSASGFLWFWLRTVGLSQALYVVPALRLEKDAAERRRLTVAAKLTAAASTAAVFAGLAAAPGPVARSGAASLAAIMAVLYGCYVAARARR